MEPKPPEAPGQAIFTNAAAGAVYRAVHMVREVKIYPIEENELKTLSMYSGIVTVVASIASIAFGLLLSIWWDLSVTKDQTQVNIGKGFMFACVGVILVCSVVGVWAQISRKSELRKILSESRIWASHEST